MIFLLYIFVFLVFWSLHLEIKRGLEAFLIIPRYPCSEVLSRNIPLLQPLDKRFLALPEGAIQCRQDSML